MKLRDIAKQLMDAKHVLISAHTNPDGDAIGAMVAMGHFCKYKHVPYTILLESIPEKFSYLLDQVNIATSVEEVDTVLALDCGNAKRLVGYEAYFRKARVTLSIDHHVTNDQYAMYNYVKPDASSTSELIYNLYKQEAIEINDDMGKALYTGMLTDTGGFMHSCTSKETMYACGELIQFDFNFSALYHKLIHEKNLVTIQLESKAISHLKCLKKGIYMAYLTEEEMDSLSASKDDVDGIVSYLKNISGVDVIAFLYPVQERNGYKLSTRSNPPYDVATLCEHFGGGGHVLAAGATLSHTLEESLKQIENALMAL